MNREKEVQELLETVARCQATSNRDLMRRRAAEEREAKAKARAKLLEAEVLAMRESARWLFENGHLEEIHQDIECPMDDTCECRTVRELCRLLDGSTALRLALGEEPVRRDL